MTSDDHAEAFLGHVDADRDWAATRLGLDLLEAEGAAVLVAELLVPVQREAGRRWQDTTYTVADEHHVTGLVDELMGAASMTLPRPGEDAPSVVLVCAEGEWHASAARMTSLQLRAAGWDVRFLGASMPAVELERHLRGAASAALVVSCTMTAALVGAAMMTDVAHRVGVPVVLGGAAFAVSARAGEAVGGDAVVTDPGEVPSLLRSWQDVAPPPKPGRGLGPSRERSALGASRRRLVQAVVDATKGPFRPEDEQELAVLLATLEAALLVDDVDVLVDHMRWLGQREQARQVLPVPMGQVVDMLARSLPTDLRTSRRFLTTAAEHVRPG